jgi:hypothetical protein
MHFRFDQRTQELLTGAIDIHIHPGPDVYPRILNDYEVAASAKENGMRAVMIKNHFFPTAIQAQVASEINNFPVFGGIALNLSVGGLNHHAVEMALKAGARQIWLPTLHARQFILNKSHIATLSSALGADIQGISLLNDKGELREELGKILDLIAQSDAILGTGHVGIPEARAVVREAAARGVQRIVITHPIASFLNYGEADMKEMLDLGATFLEHTWNDVTRNVAHPREIRDIIQAVRALGSDKCILSTDAGQWLNPPPAQQMGIMIKEMLNHGLTDAEVRAMVAGNPARLLGLD